MGSNVNIRCPLCNSRLTVDVDDMGLPTDCPICGGEFPLNEEVLMQDARPTAVHVHLFTTELVNGVTHRMSMIVAQCVAGVSMLSEFKSAFTDALGGRSKTLEKQFEFLQAQLESDLKRQANRLGANAVIGVRYQFGPVSGQSSIMLWGTAQGTPVVVESLGKG